jgi:hypothetical protein
MLRAFVLIASIALLICGVVLCTFDAVLRPLGAELLGLGVIVLLSMLFERRYRSPKRISAAAQATGERFIDPGTGKLVEVYYDPATGEREYRQR